MLIKTNGPLKMYIARAYSRNLGQCLILAKKGTFYEKITLFIEKRAPKFHTRSTPLFNPFFKCFASK